MATEREALVALNMVPDIGPAGIRKLRDFFGSAREAVEAATTGGGLSDCPGFVKARATAIADALRAIDPAHEAIRASKMGVTLVTLADPEYPEILKKIHDPPAVLYCFGDLGAFGVPAVAMVGTRVPSAYGDATARRFAFAIARAGYCVVSGMARGIDTASHRGALDAGGRTIGVLGGAIDCFYPPENRELGRAVAKTGGLVVSEFPLGRKPDKGTFPMRNRIISGLSRLTLVVEAAAKSGSLITANQAMEQGRAVMAIPGRIDVPTSLGCNLLIKDGAAMALTPDDILAELDSLDFGQVQPAPPARGGGAAAKAPAPPRPFVPLSDDEQRLLDAIGAEETLIDDVIRASGVDAGRANALLLALQLKRLAEILPGGWVRKKR